MPVALGYFSFTPQGGTEEKWVQSTGSGSNKLRVHSVFSPRLAFARDIVQSFLQKHMED